MPKEEIEKCRKESLCVSLNVAESAADKSLTPIHQLAIIKKRYQKNNGPPHTLVCGL